MFFTCLFCSSINSYWSSKITWRIGFLFGTVKYKIVDIWIKRHSFLEAHPAICPTASSFIFLASSNSISALSTAVYAAQFIITEGLHDERKLQIESCLLRSNYIYRSSQQSTSLRDWIRKGMGVKFSQLSLSPGD